MNDADGKRRTELAARIREARTLAGLSQGQVARMLQMHRPSISEIEAGNRRVTVDELSRMAELFDVSLEWLYAVPRQDAPEDSRLQLAARELGKLKPDDLDRLMKLLAAMRQDQGERGRS
ncbi:MAG TPA: helix-turn-helix transcriptional regulator [Rhodanobacter sp.]|nr:helix-turn-helix transcriptional regulator [Rhodanobacter sp.]HEV2740739.1 helix-turn-helix transcriptional regulator [Candidatus Elarobacter sp.]